MKRALPVVISVILAAGFRIAQVHVQNLFGTVFSNALNPSLI